jgi:hypothetical protein
MAYCQSLVVFNLIRHESDLSTEQLVVGVQIRVLKTISIFG